MGSCHERDIVLKALILSVPACTLFAGAAVLSFRSRSVPSLLQLLGAGCLIVVVLTHDAEALDLFPGMGWGIESIGEAVEGF
jgi:hypothetical protein